MTEPAPPPSSPPRPDPSAALHSRFTAIWQGPMAGLPMLNPALQVQALGFRPWGEHWLGVLLTPWFMNLVLMPRVAAHWQPVPERASRHHVFPAGVFEFIGCRDPELGDYQACSLFSPMFEFADQAGAAATARAALEALFDAGHRLAADVPAAQAAPPAAPSSPATPPAARAVSKRDFLFGTPRDRGS